MLPKKSILRYLIVAEISLITSSVVADLVLEHTLPTEIQHYISRSAETPITSLEAVGLGLGILLLLLMLIAWVGLWRLWKPARLLYTLCWLFGVPLFLLLDSAVYYTPLGAALSEYAILSAGMILGLLYFSDLSSNFSIAEPATAPNDGPAASHDNLNAPGRPLSVS
ncbi:MAG: hypothetical protein H0X66_18820 [Verrucomicrobia bacterium]|jgi:hypothetical protein|nr:hypothetical protein [Verrucomicrobiota bacterium]